MLTLERRLSEYSSLWLDENRFEEDPKIVDSFFDFLSTHSNCYSRSLLVGHITASALVTPPDLSRVLLTHHRNLQRWLQLGGHCDGNPNVSEMALREAEEESGIENLRLASPRILDLDIHEIPSRKDEPAHLHYDVRFLVIAPEPDRISVSEESLDLRWFEWEAARELTEERSMRRQFEKVRFLRENRCPSFYSSSP